MTLRRKTQLKRKTRLRLVSEKREVENTLYKIHCCEWREARIIKDGYLRCEMVGDGRAPSLELGERCLNMAMQPPHHRKKRGKHLTEKRWFQAQCFEHHRFIHDNQNWARKRGYLLS